MRALFAVLFWLSISSAAYAKPFTPAEAAKVDQIVAEAMAEVGTPSASVAIVRDGEVVFAKTYGLRQLDPAKPASPDTRYRIGSVSKQFTAAAVLMLADQGKVSLDAPLNRYLPELGPDDRRTVRQALSHTAGFPDFWATYLMPFALTSPTSPDAIIERWGKAVPVFAPGSRWAYSNTGYVVLGRLVERVSGQPLAAFLRGRIFQPLAMTSASDAEGDAVGYVRLAAGPPRVGIRPAPGWTFGCGDLSMTAGDLARWDVALLRHRLLSSSAYDAMTTEATLSGGAGTGYGLGLFVDRVGEYRRLRHNGDMPGYWTENRVYPDHNAAVAVMINSSYGGSPHAVIANGIEAMLLPAATQRSPDEVLGTLFKQIRDDRLDRGALSDDASAYLSGQVLDDYRDSFRRLGSPAEVILVGDREDNGARIANRLLVWPDIKLMVEVRIGADEKVEDFFVYPVWVQGQ